MTSSYANVSENESLDVAELVPGRELQGNTESTAPVIIGEEAIRITLGDWKT